MLLVIHPTVSLAFHEGLSHRDIAEPLQRLPGTMNSRIRRGLLALNSSLRTLRWNVPSLYSLRGSHG